MREGSVSGTLAFLLNRIAQTDKRSLLQKTKLLASSTQSDQRERFQYVSRGCEAARAEGQGFVSEKADFGATNIQSGTDLVGADRERRLAAGKPSSTKAAPRRCTPKNFYLLSLFYLSNLSLFFLKNFPFTPFRLQN